MRRDLVEVAAFSHVSAESDCLAPRMISGQTMNSPKRKIDPGTASRSKSELMAKSFAG